MEISQNQKQALDAAARDFDLNFLVMFGSQTTQLMHSGSDLDIGYFSKNRLDYRREFALTTTLQKIFSDHSVDLVNLGLASPLLQYRACFTGQLLAENAPHSFATFQMIAHLKYLETKPLRQLRRQFVAQTIERR